jgi:hypothetical protein
MPLPRDLQTVLRQVDAFSGKRRLLPDSIMGQIASYLVHVCVLSTDVAAAIAQVYHARTSNERVFKAFRRLPQQMQDDGDVVRAALGCGCVELFGYSDGNLGNSSGMFQDNEDYVKHAITEDPKTITCCKWWRGKRTLVLHYLRVLEEENRNCGAGTVDWNDIQTYLAPTESMLADIDVAEHMLRVDGRMLKYVAPFQSDLDGGRLVRIAVRQTREALPFASARLRHFFEQEEQEQAAAAIRTKRLPASPPRMAAGRPSKRHCRRQLWFDTVETVEVCASGTPGRV